MKAAATESLAEKIFDKDRIQKFLNLFSFIDRNGEDGYWLGFLIDYDKKNIDNISSASVLRKGEKKDLGASLGFSTSS